MTQLLDFGTSHEHGPHENTKKKRESEKCERKKKKSSTKCILSNSFIACQLMNNLPVAMARFAIGEHRNRTEPNWAKQSKLFICTTR